MGDGEVGRDDVTEQRTLVLHVGPHKTGSTYLQHRLLKSREALRSEGWEYPEFGVSQFAQHRIYAWLAGHAAASGDVTDASFAEMVAQHPRIILSSEDFVYLKPDRLRHLHSLLPETQVQIVYFVRTPVDLWPSHWQELVRHGRDDTLLEYLSAFAGWTATFEALAMNPIGHLTKYAENFGQDALRIVCYNNIIEQGGDIFDFFWRNVLRIENPVPAGEARIIHPSQPLHMIEMLRSLNQLYRDRAAKSPNDRILTAYQKRQKSIEATPAYDEFKQGFFRNAGQVRLSSKQELIRSQERGLINVFGHLVMNKAGPDQLFLKDSFERALPYAKRYWVEKFGLHGFVAEVLESLELA